MAYQTDFSANVPVPDRGPLVDTQGFAAYASGVAGTPARLVYATAKVATVDLTAAQILALYTTGIAVIPAVDSNRTFLINAVNLLYTFGTTPYTLGASSKLQLKYTNNAGVAAFQDIAAAGILDQSANVQAVADNSGALIVAPAANAPVVIGASVANPTLGDGLLSIQVIYSEIPVAF